MTRLGEGGYGAEDEGVKGRALLYSTGLLQAGGLRMRWGKQGQLSLIGKVRNSNRCRCLVTWIDGAVFEIVLTYNSMCACHIELISLRDNFRLIESSFIML